MQLKLYVDYSSCMEKGSSTGTSEEFHFKTEYTHLSEIVVINVLYIYI